MKTFKALEIKTWPFANLPEKRNGGCGAGLTATKMKECRWLKPVLREDKNPTEVRREYARHTQR
jgi:hypothetical protein